MDCKKAGWEVESKTFICLTIRFSGILIKYLPQYLGIFTLQSPNKPFFSALQYVSTVLLSSDMDPAEIISRIQYCMLISFEEDVYTYIYLKVGGNEKQ
jgi:hypothetical protein